MATTSTQFATTYGNSSPMPQSYGNTSQPSPSYQPTYYPQPYYQQHQPTMSNQLIDGAATVGRVETTISLVVISIVCFVIFCVGIAVFRTKDLTMSTVGTVIANNVIRTKRQNSTIEDITYNIDIKYKDTSNNEHTSTLVGQAASKEIGSTTTIYYNDKNIIVTAPINHKKWGILIIFLSIIIWILYFLWWKLVNSNKTIAAFSGANTLAQTIF
jgi:hypothetical protein